LSCTPILIVVNHLYLSTGPRQSFALYFGGALPPCLWHSRFISSPWLYLIALETEFKKADASVEHFASIAHYISKTFIPLKLTPVAANCVNKVPKTFQILVQIVSHFCPPTKRFSFLT